MHVACCCRESSDTSVDQEWIHKKLDSLYSKAKEVASLPTIGEQKKVLLVSRKKGTLRRNQKSWIFPYQVGVVGNMLFFVELK